MIAVRKIIWRTVFFWKSYEFWAFVLKIRDKIILRNMSKETRQHYLDMKKHLDRQRREWNSMAYCAGYFYQGYLRLGVHGYKPTEKRLERYGISEYFNPELSAFDIGSNNGFLVCYISSQLKKADGIEINPFLVDLSNETAKFLSLTNVGFFVGDFENYLPKETYDIIFSLSNHHTIDGNLRMNFEDYIIKVNDMMNDGGMFFFESHDLNGDDSDIDSKVSIMRNYFNLEKAKMIKPFVPADISKLFMVFKKDKKNYREKNNTFFVNEILDRYEYKSY